jgi:hypothetical protein
VYVTTILGTADECSLALKKEHSLAIINVISSKNSAGQIADQRRHNKIKLTIN